MNIENMTSWEMFLLITNAYYGKQYYFRESNEIVYSRASNKYMTVDEAVEEFLDILSGWE